MNVVAVIPARIGSRRIVQKNLAPLGGIPLVSWTIRAAHASRRVTHVVVSTDSDAIAAVAHGEGARVVRRGPDLSADHVWSAPVVDHALDSVRTLHGKDYALLLHPTSPFRMGEHIDRCVDLLDAWAGSVVTFTDDDLNGALYAARVRHFRHTGSFLRMPIQPVTLDEVAGLDIDLPVHLAAARAALGNMTAEEFMAANHSHRIVEPMYVPPLSR